MTRQAGRAPGARRNASGPRRTPRRGPDSRPAADRTPAPPRTGLPPRRGPDSRPAANRTPPAADRTPPRTGTVEAHRNFTERSAGPRTCGRMNA
ncbi:hypothetical protein AB852_30980 [Streptomyces uncialis]|uniref:Uncharacterized protein n=1 Tax=Streptomyces uncialis TaxID=1048205 RepID=A0A1Q4UZI3_9ACTN|nr:hypothetical protein AB852_30980 [Streptomyces uncialis]